MERPSIARIIEVSMSHYCTNCGAYSSRRKFCVYTGCGGAVEPVPKRDEAMAIALYAHVLDRDIVPEVKKERC